MAPVVAVLVVALAAGAAAPLAVAAGSEAAGPRTGPSVLPVRDSGSIGRLDLVARIQAELTRRGYAIGPIDGVPGPRTVAAIRAYQQSRRLIPNGWPTEDLFRIMQRESAATGHYGQPVAPAIGLQYATPPAAASLPRPAGGSRAVAAPRSVAPPAAPPVIAPPAVTAGAGGGLLRSGSILDPPRARQVPAGIGGSTASLSRATPAATSAASPARRAHPPRSFVPRRRLVELIQTYLTRKGYNVGVVDGLYGRRTAAAIRAYQQDNGLPPDGLATIGLYNVMQADALEERQPTPPARAAIPGVATLDLLPPPGPVTDSAAPPPDPTPLPQPAPMPTAEPPLLFRPVPEEAVPVASGSAAAAPVEATSTARAPGPARPGRVPAATDTGAIAPLPRNAPVMADIPIPASNLTGETFDSAILDLPPPEARPADDIAGTARPVPSSAGAPFVRRPPTAADPAVNPLAPPPPDDTRAPRPQQEAQSGLPSGPAALIDPPPMPYPVPQPPSRPSRPSAIETAETALPLAPDDPVATAPGLPFSVSVEAPPPPRTDAALRIAGTTWRLTDDNGASQIMTFEADGSISGTDFDAFVTWRQFGDSIQIQYDNGFGRAVYREGRFDDGVLTGEGRSDTGSRWRWTAERLRGRR